MKKSMPARRKFLARVRGAALAVGVGACLPELLASCASESQDVPGTVTLTYGWWSNTPAKDAAMRAWIGDFERSHPSIKMQVEILPWNTYWDKLETTIAGGKAYDIIGLASNMAATFFESDALLDLTSYPDYDAVVAHLNPATVALSTWNNKACSLPVGVAVSVLGYNKALLNAAGVPTPHPTQPMSFDEFKMLARKLSRPGKQYALNPMNIVDYDTFVHMNGAQTFDRQVNPRKVTINTPDGIQGLIDYKSLFTEQIVPPYADLLNGPWSFDLGALETGKVVFARVGPWLFSDMAKNSNYGITPLFSLKKSVVLGGVNSLAIYKGSKHQAAAWEFLRWATQTGPEISFAKFSDLPVEQQAFAQLPVYLKPANFAPTMIRAFSAFQPGVMTARDQLLSTFNDLIADMMADEITPAETAARMEQEGNAILVAS